MRACWRCTALLGCRDMRSRLPAFNTVIKSRAVEDPIDVWLHRPLAYACIALVSPLSVPASTTCWQPNMT